MSDPVSIIVLNYNGKRFLKECLDSLLKQTYIDFEIIFFDNASEDDSIKFVQENYQDKRLICVEATKNLGFAGGNNEAIKHAKNDLIVLVNNDTKADTNWLENLVNAVNEGNTIASSYFITEGINPRYYETNGSVSFLMYNVMNIFEKIEEEFYPSGGSLVFRKSEIEVPFDEDYFYYSEDLYLGLKARFSGMKIKFVKDSIIHHFGGGSSQNNITKTYFQERNRLLNLYLFFSFSFIVKVQPLILIVNSIKLLASSISPKWSFWGLIKANLWFFFHFKNVFRKRKELKQFKKVDEKEIIRYMTSKLLNHETPLKRTINNISYRYSRIMGIKPIEFYQRNPTR